MLSWLGIGASIVGKLAAAYEAKANAKTEEERIKAERDIATLTAQAQAQRPVDAFVRILFAFPVAIYFGKLFLWDKVFGLGRTDPLSPELEQVAMVVIGFYFIDRIVARVKR